MRILITGGGTGGHVFPALEVARLAQKQGHQAVYFGSLRGQEAELAPKSGVAFEGFSMLPFVAFRLPSWVATLKAIRAVRRRLFTQKFDVVLSTGGYPGGAVLIAIQAFDVPVVFLEANAVPGKVHRLRMKNLMKVCVVFEEAIQYYAVPCERTGLPLREELVEAAQVPLPRQEKEFTTVCLGGSQGAETLNRAFLDMVGSFYSNLSLKWVQVCGKKLYQDYLNTVSRCPFSSLRVEPFMEGAELARLYLGADVAISRAGAGTLFELALFGIPSVLVPYPYASFAHQERNAKAIQRLGGAVIVDQNKLTSDALGKAWLWWYESKERRESAFHALRGWSVPDATQRVLKALIEAKDAFQNRSR